MSVQLLAILYVIWGIAAARVYVVGSEDGPEFALHGWFFLPLPVIPSGVELSI